MPLVVLIVGLLLAPALVYALGQRRPSLAGPLALAANAVACVSIGAIWWQQVPPVRLRWVPLVR
jgi:hypothetical protein